MAKLLTIEQLEQIMLDHPLLPKPKLVYMVKTRVVGVIPDGVALELRGATPKDIKDRIAITATADEVTVVHEMLHLAGFGELGAYTLAPIIRAARKLFPPLIKGSVKYRKVAEPHPLVEVYARVD